MYTCVYIYIYKGIYICIYTYMGVYVYICVCVCVCVCVYIYIYIYVKTAVFLIFFFFCLLERPPPRSLATGPCSSEVGCDFERHKVTTRLVFAAPLCFAFLSFTLLCFAALAFFRGSSHRFCRSMHSHTHRRARSHRVASLQPGNRPLRDGGRGRGLRPLGQVHSTAPAVQQAARWAPLRYAWERVGGANHNKLNLFN